MPVALKLCKWVFGSLGGLTFIGFVSSCSLPMQLDENSPIASDLFMNQYILKRNAILIEKQACINRIGRYMLAFVEPDDGCAGKIIGKVRAGSKFSVQRVTRIKDIAVACYRIEVEVESEDSKLHQVSIPSCYGSRPDHAWTNKVTPYDERKLKISHPDIKVIKK